jgi:hypothetical protein
MYPSGSDPVRRERRMRLDAVVVVKCSLWPDALALPTLDVSRGGMFICMHEPPPIGTPIVVYLRRQDGWVDIPSTVARVVNTTQIAHEAGFGVRFDTPGEVELNAINELLDQARGSGPICLPEDPSDETAEALEAELRRLRKLPAHEVLGVGRRATEAEIDAALERLQARYSPDSVFHVTNPRVRAAVAACFIEVRRARDELLNSTDEHETITARCEHLLASARALQERGNVEEACRQLEIVLRLEPEREEAVTALRNLWAARRTPQAG